MFAAIYTAAKSAPWKRCAEAFSPLVEETAPGLVTLDIGGLGKLIGDPAQIGDAILKKAEALGFDANVAIASNPDAAVLAARGFSGVTVIPCGKEAKSLAELPLELLLASNSVREIFQSWGIRTFGDLALLPERGIAERLGTEGLLLQKRARGLAHRPLIPAIEPEQFEDSAQLEHPLDLLEPLAFVLSGLLTKICSRLGVYGLASNQVDLRMTLDNRTGFERSIRIPFPTRDASLLLKLLQYDLAAHPPKASILSVHCRLVPVPPQVIQNGLFLPQSPEPQKLELTLARIAAIVGETNAGSPELLDTHRPGAFRMSKFTASMRASERQDCVPHLAIRLFRPPLPLNVTAFQGRPERVIAQGIQGKVVAWAGPWRTSGDWWTQNPWERDEWDIALQNGSLYRIYLEPRNGWFLEGNYD